MTSTVTGYTTELGETEETTTTDAIIRIIFSALKIMSFEFGKRYSEDLCRTSAL